VVRRRYDWTAIGWWLFLLFVVNIVGWCVGANVVSFFASKGLQP
jgi:hypothetical protein